MILKELWVRDMAGRKKWEQLLRIVGVVGPALITVNAGNDAGGIATYASIGANYGYKMLWGLLIITIALAVIQEMNARMAVVTGKGLSDLIREEFGVGWTLFAMVTLLVANIGVVMGDFAGVASSMELFGIPRYISVPVMAFLVWYLVLRGTYERVEKVFLVFTLFFFAYIFSAFLAKPSWGEVGKAVITPTLELNRPFLLTFIGMIGTTITPYMQFYLQSSIAEKRISWKDYFYEKVDVYFSAIWGELVAFFIIISTAATLYVAGISVDSAAEAALALKPLAGEFAFLLFGLGLFGASVLATAIIPLSTTYAICEAFGWERGVNYSFREAPVFFGLYTAIIVLGAAVVLIPSLSLFKIMVVTQQIAGILSPIILIFMIKLVNNPRVMGEHVNTRLQNVIAWLTVLFIIFLTLTLVLVQGLGL
ncbi:MAG: hypothetical protein PWQ31_614 [Eubacteriales bacterium]|nr:hypothetical protein [Eubacteriales bacterium]